MKTAQEILKDLKNILHLEDKVFESEISRPARELTFKNFNKGIFVSALLATSSFCRNSCTYCGLRCERKDLKRYRLSLDEIKLVINKAKTSGLNRLFFTSGEDIHFAFDDILSMIRHAKQCGLHVTLGLGIFSEDQLKQIKDAGADCYVLKFETSNREMFKKIKPRVDFDERMECIKTIKKLGMELGSGNIIGLEGQTIDDIVNDIVLMEELGIAWAPVVPYLPAPSTPMAETTPMGSVSLTLKVISILRILMPGILITAGQPSQGSKLGFSDPKGNKDALNAGGNILFADVTPYAVRKDFDIAPGRILPELDQIDKLLSEMGLHRIKQ